MTDYDIYLDFCGCKCPCPEKSCGSCDSDGICMRSEPWFDCDNFQNAHEVDIDNAEDEILRVELNNDGWDYLNDIENEEDY